MEGEPDSRCEETRKRDCVSDDEAEEYRDHDLAEYGGGLGGKESMQQAGGDRAGHGEKEARSVREEPRARAGHRMIFGGLNSFESNSASLGYLRVARHRESGT